jgi:hypothetical protein
MNIEEERKKIISSLTAARLEKNLSQEALARLVGTKRSNISRMRTLSAGSGTDRRGDAALAAAPGDSKKPGFCS